MLKIRLHESVTARSLALGRIWVFAIWTVFVLLDPVQNLTFLPIELFHSYGIFDLVPQSFWAAVLTPAGLLGFKVVLLVLYGWAAIGFRGARVVAGVAALLTLTYLQVKKGFGGHWDHREMTLLYITALMSITPAWDAFAVHRSPRAGSRRPGVYRASLIAACLVIVLQYLFIGAARLFIGGPGVFLGGTLQKWIENRNLRPNPFGFNIGTWFLDPFWAPILDFVFFASTVLEFAVLLMLFIGGRRLVWLKVLLVLSFASFHGAIFLLMNVAFPEDVAILLLFFDIETPLRAMRRGRTGGGTVRFDPENATAAVLADRTGRRVPALAISPTPGVAGGLEFVDDDGVSTTGEQARTEVLFRTPGRLLQAWWRSRGSGRSGPLPPDRGTFGTWMLGSRADEVGQQR